MKFMNNRPVAKIRYRFFLEINGVRMSNHLQYKSKCSAFNALRKEAREYLVSHPNAEFGYYEIIRYSVGIKSIKL